MIVLRLGEDAALLHGQNAGAADDPPGRASR